MLCFEDLRQVISLLNSIHSSFKLYLQYKTIELVTAKQWSIYLNDFGNGTGKYNRVHPSNALILLEK